MRPGSHPPFPCGSYGPAIILGVPVAHLCETPPVGGVGWVVFDHLLLESYFLFSEFAVQTSSVRFSDVGGCEKTLEEVCKLVLHLRHPEVFSWLGVTPPQGFLLHGPPGCGKTLLAHAIAGVSE